MAVVCPKCLDSIDDDATVSCPTCGAMLQQHRRRAAVSEQAVAAATQARVTATATATATVTVAPPGLDTDAGSDLDAALEAAAAAVGGGAAPGTAAGPRSWPGLPGLPAGSRVRTQQPAPAKGRKGRRAMRIGRGSGSAQLVIWGILVLVVLGLILGMVLLSNSASSGQSAQAAHAALAAAGLAP